MKICSVEECTRTVHRKTMCQSHYRRTRIYGSPTGGRRPPGSEAAICSVESCCGSVHAGGLCSTHRKRYLKHGTVAEVPRQVAVKSLAAKLAEGTPTGLPDTECWEWVSTMGSSGYGRISYGGKQLRAHRVAYALAHDTKIPKGLVVRHRCDTPPCVNPKHLEIGTDSDNVRDKVSRGRNPVGESAGQAKLTEDEVLRIRKMYAEGSTTTSLAKEFNVASGTIYPIVHRKTWRHV